MLEAISSDSEGGTGDVKYHLGAQGRRVTPSGEINVTLAANPSHLEAVDPVVEGRTRADQTDRSTREGLHDPSVALAILIHGDAAFPAQGVVAETLNLSYLDGYATGRHAPSDLEQPGRLHDGARGRPVDALLERPREGLRRADHPRQRRRSRGGDRRRPARARVPPAVLQRRRHRPRRLPAARPQRAGRGRVHAAADGGAHRSGTRRCASSSRSGSRSAGIVTERGGRAARRRR